MICGLRPGGVANYYIRVGDAVWWPWARAPSDLGRGGLLAWRIWWPWVLGSVAMVARGVAWRG